MSPAEVLVVEDKQREAENFVRLIEAATGLRAVKTDNPADAEELVKEGKIKVAVLDQVLEGTDTTGTVLLERLRVIEPDIRGILFSGQFSRDDAIDAYKKGIFEVLDKANVAELPSVVLAAYGSYLAAMAERAAAKSEAIVTQRFFMRRRSVRYEVLAITPPRDEEDDAQEVVLDKSYEEYLKLEAGQTERHAVARGAKVSVVIENESLEKLRTDVGGNVHLVKLQTSIESIVRAREETTVEESAKASQEKEFSLPAARPQGDAPTVRARRYERAPIYRRERTLIRVKCDCCGTHLELLSVLVPTGRFRTRHTDFMSDNTQSHPVDTG